MTQEIIKRFAQEHGLSTIRAMTVLVGLVGEIKEAAASTEAQGKDMIPHFSIEAIGWK